MITPEAMPFASTGGLAESVTSLSSALVDKGHNVKSLCLDTMEFPKTF